MIILLSVLLAIVKVPIEITILSAPVNKVILRFYNKNLAKNVLISANHVGETLIIVLLV